MPAIVFVCPVWRRPQTLRDAQRNLDGTWLVPGRAETPATWAYEADLRRALTRYEGHDAREFYARASLRWPNGGALRPWLVEYTQAEFDEVLAELVLQDLAEVV